MLIKNVLEKISSTGLTDSDIADLITSDGHKVSQSVINRLRRGVHKYTFYERHKKIVDLYERLLKQKEIPEPAQQESKDFKESA